MRQIQITAVISHMDNYETIAIFAANEFPPPVGERVYRNKIFINQYITRLRYFYFPPILPHKLLPKFLNTGTLKSHVVYVVGVVSPYFS